MIFFAGIADMSCWRISTLPHSEAIRFFSAPTAQTITICPLQQVMGDTGPLNQSDLAQ